MKDHSNPQKFREEIYLLLKEAVSARLRFLPGVSSLAAALLVVATFNNQLFQLTCFVRILITLLLLLIPTSIFFYLYELNEAANNAQKALQDELNITSISTSKPFFLILGAYFPWVAWLIISFIILSIVVLIWA